MKDGVFGSCVSGRELLHMNGRDVLDLGREPALTGFSHPPCAGTLQSQMQDTPDAGFVFLLYAITQGARCPMWLPGWLYKALPFIYAGGGFVSLNLIEYGLAAVFCGLVLFAAALLTASWRYAAYRDKARPDNRISACGAAGASVARAS